MRSVYRDWAEDWELACGKRAASLEELREALSYWLDKVLEMQEVDSDVLFWANYWASMSTRAGEVLRDMFGSKLVPEYIADPHDAVEFLASLISRLEAELGLGGGRRDDV